MFTVGSQLRSGCPILARLLRKGGLGKSGNHERRHNAFQFVILAKMRERPLPRDRLHSPHARRDAAFLQNLDQPNLARSRRVRPAAKLRRKIPNPHHAHLVAILLPEQRHRVILIHRHVNRHVDDRLHFLIPQQLLIDQVFNILQLFIRDRGEMRKIKPQMPRRHQRSRLLHMLPQNLAQPGMQQMRSRMIPHSGLPHVGINDRIHLIPDLRVPHFSRAFCARSGDFGSDFTTT